MTMTQEQFDKLPKWAQAEFRTAKRQIETLQNRIGALVGEEKTDISIEFGHGVNDKTVQYLNPDYGIDFDLGSGGMINVRIESQVSHNRSEFEDRKILRITGQGHPSALVVIPQVTNVLHVGVIR